MIDVAELNAQIARSGKCKKDVALMLNMTPKTFYAKMKKGVFGSDEIQTMIDELNIPNPMDIFFAKEVT